MEEFPKLTFCTFIEFGQDKITKQQILDQIKQQLDELTEGEVISRVIGRLIVKVDEEDELAAGIVRPETKHHYKG